ncbi:diacylglycerol kinase family protein [Streptomyces kunmingensis]|uniref:Diacylglycerol kinase family protein n=1 Tax=Streptomyces kunmingensis TaxID=68225 RepID=A0ABU6CBV3_9ACTN|nr:diacylglycerol kinase [Streptomyces kunmingensis]MEB3962198.1 diacylglycerol kinase family protein [Streptomyces kunmingensis]
MDHPTDRTDEGLSRQILVLVDPLARRSDGESVRIAKDVLCAGATVKVCLPEGPEEFAKALARRGARRPVVVGDDRALLRAVSLLHRERELSGAVLSMVPVGGAVSLAHSLGIPTETVAAARAALDGAERRLDLLVDDSDGVVLGDLRIPPVAEGPSGAAVAAPPWLRTCRSLVRTLAARPARPPAPESGAPARLRVEVDGVTLIDLDQPVEGVSVGPATGTGLARVEIRRAAGSPPLHAVARTISVSGADFRYRTDALAIGGPVRRRTWTVRVGAWRLALP